MLIKEAANTVFRIIFGTNNNSDQDQFKFACNDPMKTIQLGKTETGVNVNYEQPDPKKKKIFARIDIKLYSMIKTY